MRVPPRSAHHNGSGRGRAADEPHPALSPVPGLLDAVGRRSAARRARQVAVEPVAITPVPGNRPLRCRACGRVDFRSADQLRKLVRRGWPECCGRPMPPADEPEPDLVPAAEPARPDPCCRPRPGTRASVRRGLLGMGPDLALELLNVTTQGVLVRLVEPVGRREEVEVALGSTGSVRPVRLPALPESCEPAADGSFVAELRFRRPLTAESVAEFA